MWATHTHKKEPKAMFNKLGNWFSRQKPQGPVEVPIFQSDNSGKEVTIVWTVGLYVHTKDNTTQTHLAHKLHEGQAYVRIVPGEYYSNRNVRKAAGLQPWEMFYDKQFFIPCRNITRATQIKEVEFHAQKLKEEGKIVELYTPDQPYSSTPEEAGPAPFVKEGF